MLPDNWHEMTPDEKFEARFDAWISTENKAFASEEAARTYARRTRRYYDIIKLQQPDRVPCHFTAGGFMPRYAGMTCGDFFYDYGKTVAAHEKFYNDFEVDYQVAGGALPGGVLDRLDYRLYSWPGGDLPEDKPFQFNEKEYMRADEYDDLIVDPEAFLLRAFMPRAFGALEGLRKMPLALGATELPYLPGLLAPFAAPGLRDALAALMEAGQQMMDWMGVMGGIMNKLRSERGLPGVTGGASKAPFDFVGDSLRGTHGIMLDMYRQPEKVLEACERLVPLAVKMAVQGADASGVPVVRFTLHKGADNFMSPKDFERFYWPSFRAVLLGVIEEGIVPSLFVEGAYNRRLDVIADAGLPKGKTLWHFDQTDMAEAKKKIGGWGCIGGNVPISLFKAGTPEQVADAVKAVIDIAAPGGGYFLAPGADFDDAEEQNIRAFLETARTYGVY